MNKKDFSLKFGVFRDAGLILKKTLALLLLMTAGNVSAQVVDDFYIPLPESEALTFFDQINTGTGAVLITRTDIVIRANSSEIIFDDASDGYESQYTTPGAWVGNTELWGNGDCSDGFNPNLATCVSPADDATDVFTIGEVIVFDQTEVSAGDYFRSNSVINLTRSMFPQTPGTVLAGAFELFPTQQWGTSYVVPIGETIPGALRMFEQVALTIMASEDNTDVEIDVDGPSGAAPLINVTLDRGESVEYGIGLDATTGQALVFTAGATVTATAPVQVNVLTGDIDSGYGSRFYTLFPDALLSDEYYEAVSTTDSGEGAAIFMYNPNGAAITVNVYNNSNPTGAPTAVAIASNAVVKFDVPTATAQGETGLRLASTGDEVFTAYTVIDDEQDEAGAPAPDNFDDQGLNHDWGHVTTPLRLTGDVIRVGFAPGRSPVVVSTQNASPVWIVADDPGAGITQDIQICVDSAGDGGAFTDPITLRQYDYVVTVQPLDSTRLYDNGPDAGAVNNNSGTQTGMLAFSCDPVDGVTASTPSDVILAAAWGQDPLRASIGSPGFDVGTTIRTGSDTNLFIGDLVFEDFDGDGVQDLSESGISGVDVTITSLTADVDPDTVGIQLTLTIQTDANGLYLFTGLDRGEDYTIEVTPPVGYSPVSDPDGLVDNQTTLTLNSSTLAQDFGYSQAVIGDFIYYDIDGDGVIDPGDTGIAGVEVQLCGPGSLLIEDDFETQSYSNNLADWDNNSWSETDDDGVVTTGDIFVNGTGSLNLNGNSDGGIFPTLTRQLDLSAITGNATLTIDWTGGDSAYETDDEIEVQVSIAGGGFTTLFTFEGQTIDNTNGSESLVFDPLGSNNVDIRFVVDEFWGTGSGQEVLFIDNVDISGTTTICQLTTTDANGFYIFAGLIDGAYTVTVDPNSNTLPSNVSQTGDPDGGNDNMSAATVAAGVGSLDEDFGYQPPSISGTVTDQAAAPLSGVTIQLYSDPNGDGDPSDGSVIATTTTDVNGDYIFTNLPVDDYVVVEIDPAGYVAFSDGDASPDGGGDQANVSTLDNLIPVSLAVGELDEDNDFVDGLEGLISGQVWLDEDQDGINDIEEAGLTNILVELDDGSCTPLPAGGANCPTVQTDQFGNYVFDGLTAGTYDIVVITSSLPSGVTNTAGQFGLPSRNVVLVGGQEVTDQDFGYIAAANTGIIGDRVWSDADGDGIQDAGEAGINNVTVYLCAAVDAPCTSGNQIATTTTTADGDYLFTNIPFGDDYVVSVDSTDTDLTGFSPTTGPQSEGGYTSNPVSLSAALTTVTDIDFGFNNVTDQLSITDRIWYDANGDGVQQVGEPGIAGVSVNLLDNNGDVVTTAITDSNGDFSFLGVSNDTNYVMQISDLNNKLAGLIETTGTGGDETISGSLNAAAGADDFLDTDGDDGTPTFGFNNPGSIAGTVWNDVDASELQDNGEPGIGGVTVTLTPPAGIDLGNGDGVAITTVTAADGSYLFDGLPPGSYDIDILLADRPAGTHTEDPDSNDNHNATVVLAIGEGVINQDFGYDNDVLNDISGTVFLDTDKDGVEELNGADGLFGTADDEPGFESVTLDLIDCGAGTCDDGDEVVIASTISDSSGNYIFPGLAAGDYEVSVSDTTGLLSGYDITSGLDILSVTIVAADVTDVDFGYIKDEATASISGEVYIDENGDDSAQDEEFDLSGVTVWLCLAADAPCTSGNATATTTTDVNGEYVFTDLLPGIYEVGTDPTTIPANLTLGADPDPVSLSEGEEVTDVDIGYDPAASTGILSGVVWVDADNDGNFDPGEAPIAGVTINVTDGLGSPLFAVVTDADGKWLLTGIPIVDGVSPNDLAILYDPGDIPAGLNSLQPSNLPLGDDLYFDQDLEADPDHIIGFLDFGFPPEALTDLASIAGTIYSDTNQDVNYIAADDGELEGVTLNLIDCGAGTCSDGDETVIATTVTDANGDYLFDGLFPGDYNVVVSDIANLLKDLNPLETITSPITLNAGDDITGVDAGYISDARLGSIGNRFWFDTNQDGVIQEDEAGIEGITIQCWLDADESETPNNPAVTTNAPQPGVDNLIRTVVTDDAGEYYCTSLPTGQYIVRVFDSLDFTEVDDGTVLGTVADDTAKPWTYALTTTSPNLSADFGVSGNNSLSGSVFIEDEDLVESPDGTLDPGELDGVFDGVSDGPAAGVPVLLYSVQADSSLVLIQSTVTDANGDYSFIGLPDGDYRVEVNPDNTVIDAYGQTADPDLAAMAFPDNVCDSPTAADCDDATGTPISLSGGASVTDVDFGYQKGFTTTPVTVNYFTANSVAGGVEFNWETSNEVGHLGYQIYARGVDDWALLTEDLITSSAGSAMDIRQYRYTAYNVDATWFALIDVSAAEELTPHGPYRLDQAYGGVIDVPAEFDWGSIDVSDQPSKQDLQDSMLHRLNNLIEPEERAERQ